MLRRRVAVPRRRGREGCVVRGRKVVSGSSSDLGEEDVGGEVVR